MPFICFLKHFFRCYQCHIAYLPFDLCKFMIFLFSLFILNFLYRFVHIQLPHIFRNIYDKFPIPFLWHIIKYDVR